MHNPYTSRNMVKNTADFFGRSSETEAIFSNLKTSQNTSIVGERRAGKSSLLWHITQPEVYQKYLADTDKPYLFLFFDLQRVASLTQESFFKLLCECLLEQLPAGYASETAEVDDSQEFFRKLVLRAKKDYYIVLCIDEFETVTSNEKFDKGFLQSLRAYGNAQDVAYVTCSRVGLDEICRNTDHLQGSEFWNIFVMPPLFLGLFKPEEARELIVAPARAAGIVFEESEINYVLDLAGRHPLFLQICCFHLFEVKKKNLAAGNNGDISETDCQAILSNFLSGATPHYQSLWSKLSANEKNVLAKCDTVDSEGEAKNTLTDLIRRGLLCEDPTIRPFSKTFGAFIEKNHAPERNAVAIKTVAQTEEPFCSTLLEEMWEPGVTPAVTGRANELGKLDIWVGQGNEVLVRIKGPYSYSQFCPNRAKAESAFIQRFESRVRNLLSIADWRPEKFQIAKDVVQYFEQTPEVSQAYTKGRAATDDDERFLVTFRCSDDMLAFPFEFINSLSTVDEGEKDLVLIHPVRKSITGLTTKNRPLARDFFSDPETRVLLVSSNVSGPFVQDNRTFELPAIPGARKEVEVIEAMFAQGKKEGRIRCSVEVKHDPTLEEIKQILKSGKFDLIHYSGHATYANTPENSSLFFRQSNQGPQIIAEKLTTNELNYVIRSPRLKFFYLSCCQGAMAGSSEQRMNNNFLGITHALLMGGVPSVLAMRWPLSDTTAIPLARLFYWELLNGTGVELALTRARRQLESSRPDDHSWLSPVLVVQDG